VDTQGPHARPSVGRNHGEDEDRARGRLHLRNEGGAEAAGEQHGSFNRDIDAYICGWMYIYIYICMRNEGRAEAAGERHGSFDRDRY